MDLSEMAADPNVGKGIGQNVAGAAVHRSVSDRLGQAAPVDPRTRRVLEFTARRGGATELRLECGHTLRRKLLFHRPDRVICPHCAVESAD